MKMLRASSLLTAAFVLPGCLSAQIFLVPFGNVPTILVPLLLPVGATQVESRALTEQNRGSVIVAVSGDYPTGRTPADGGRPPIARFTNPQPYNLSYVVRLLSNGQPDPAFTSVPGGDGTVNALLVQADGRILVGGTFLSFVGVVFRNLARLQPDGKPDSTFNIGSGPASPAGTSAQVNALALQSDGSILVGGTFQTFQGQARPHLVRLTANGALDASFAPALNGPVNALATQPDGRILVGGNFTSLRGVTRNRIARLLSDGSVDTTFDPGTGANNEVVTLRLQGNGAILAGGDFTTFARQDRGRLVRLASSGAIDPTFLSSAAANDTVISISLDASGKVLLGGAFTQVNGTTRNRLARLFADGAIDPGFDPGDGANKDVRAVLPRNDGTIFLSGLFDRYQGTGVNGVVGVLGMPIAAAITQPPRSVVVSPGETARFVAEATGSGALTYQWYKDGIAIAGATEAALTLPNVTVAAEGRYNLQVTSPTGSAISDNATLSVARGVASRIINLSVLTSLEAQDPSFTLGFVIGGSGTSGAKSLLVRAVGPSLARFGIGDALADPKLRFFANSVPYGENDDWGGSVTLAALMTQVGAFPLSAPNSKDAAFSPANLTTAANSVEVSHGAGATGAVLAEIYDATPASANVATTPRLINVSVIKRIPADSKLTAGFVISGATSKTVLIRAIGPTLAGFGVDGSLGDPQLALYQTGVAAPVAKNDNWGGTAALTTAFTAVSAFSLGPASKDAALLVSLLPGSYSVEASGVGGSAGTAIVEVYEVP